MNSLFIDRKYFSGERSGLSALFNLFLLHVFNIFLVHFNWIYEYNQSYCPSSKNKLYVV